MVGRGGSVAGAVCGICLWSSLVVALIVGLLELGVSAVGPTLVPEIEADRRLTSVDENRVIIEVGIRLGVVVLSALVSLVGCVGHWVLFIKPTPNKYIAHDAVIPEDLKGGFKYGAFDCFGDFGTCCCFTWCNFCMISDLWYRAGWLHAGIPQTVMPTCENSCPGWRWFAGVCGLCLISETGCVPCAMAVGRGGVGWIDGGDGGLGEITPFRKMFGIPHSGCETFCHDCCLWCWCSPCAGTQEYRQVMDVLKRPGAGAQVVGQPVLVGGQVVGQPVVAGNEKQ